VVNVKAFSATSEGGGTGRGGGGGGTEGDEGKGLERDAYGQRESGEGECLHLPAGKGHGHAGKRAAEFTSVKRVPLQSHKTY
jgi:hypothetical protein